MLMPRTIIYNEIELKEKSGVIFRLKDRQGLGRGRRAKGKGQRAKSVVSFI
jgi:hypothetical protein